MAELDPEPATLLPSADGATRKPCSPCPDGASRGPRSAEQTSRTSVRHREHPSRSDSELPLS